MTVHIAENGCEVRCDLCWLAVGYNLSLSCRYPTKTNQRQRAARQYGFRRVLTRCAMRRIRMVPYMADVCPSCCANVFGLKLSSMPTRLQISMFADIEPMRTIPHIHGYINQRLLR